MDERLANDLVIGAWLKELEGLEVFKAQVELEDRILASSRKDLESLSLDPEDLSLRYTKVRSTIDTIKRLQSVRSQLIEDRNNKNRSPALKEKETNV